MATLLCAECTVFKEEFESLIEVSLDDDTYRTPFENFAALEKSALLGCALCLIIYQSWHHERFSERYMNDSLITVNGYTRSEWRRSKGIFVSYENSDVGGFTLNDFAHSEVSREQFSQYQTAYRQLINPSIPDGVSKLNSLAYMWLQRCVQTHPNCRSHTDGSVYKVVPTRLIDVGTDTLGQPPRLFIPLRHLRSLEYIALSYAWGTCNMIKTTFSNLESMKQHLPWTQLPKTIQDAIVLTRSLGVRYLWVDALCILQSGGLDDMAHKNDWSYEAARFGNYYENALLTISATGASSCDEGLFSSNPKLKCEPKSITFRPESASNYTIRSMIPDWYSETLSGPLSKRGWAVQERLLSRRVLHFAENMILWECHGCRATELDIQGLNPRGLDDDGDLSNESMTEFRDLYVKSLDFEDVTEQWYRFIQIYSHSNFTFVSDRLPALSGIATIVQRRIQKRYVAGLWESDIPRGLAWYRHGPTRFDTAHLIDPQITRSPSRSDSQLVLPSWSWAVSETNVFYFPRPNWTSLIEVESWHVDTQGADTSGQLHGARLTIRGVLATVDLTDLGFEPNARNPEYELGRGLKGQSTKLETVQMDTAMNTQTREHSHPCLLIGSSRFRIDDINSVDTGGALILRATGHCFGSIIEYRRIGFMSLPMEECSTIFTGQEKAITLI